jgi:exonuclease SbcD
MPRILHFADAHIDMTNYGQHDPISGLPVRVMDFLKSLDTIVNTAIDEKVDLVIFAGDTYRDRNPQPTFQREWGRRIMRLSRAGIPTLLVTGNHDISPAQVRAHAMQEFETLEPPFVHVVSRPSLLTPAQLDDVPVQVIALPWITRAGLVASLQDTDQPTDDPAKTIEGILTEMVNDAIAQLDPDLPTILAAHASVEGAKFGNEQTIKVGKDVLLQPRFVCNPRFDYVALGHIHKYQNLNEGSYPPVIYPGSIERVDFGEVNEDKGFIIADVQKGNTTFERRKLHTRPFIDLSLRLEEGNDVMGRLMEILPASGAAEGAIVRLRIDYPKELETHIDEKRLRDEMSDAFEFYLVKNPSTKARSRLDVNDGTASMPPLELMELYWKENSVSEASRYELGRLANQIISDVNGGLDA